MLQPHPVYFGDQNQAQADLFRKSPYQHSRNTSNASILGPSPSSTTAAATYAHIVQGSFTPTQDDSSRATSHLNARGSDESAASVAGATRAGPPSTLRGGPGGGPGDGPGHPDLGGPETGMMTPPSEKSGEREYLNSPEELRFMQAYVTEVGVWMDSLDREEHFSRKVPYHALRCPMLLNALLACGVKHLTLTQQYGPVNGPGPPGPVNGHGHGHGSVHGDDKALFYYDTATTQLLRSLQNPERDTAECAATAVVLNVYEIMSEKPTQRMSHIAGARALIRECGWSARSTGLGAACFVSFFFFSSSFFFRFRYLGILVLLESQKEKENFPRRASFRDSEAFMKRHAQGERIFVFPYY